MKLPLLVALLFALVAVDNPLRAQEDTGEQAAAVFLPRLQRPITLNCQIPRTTYSTLAISGPPTEIPARSHPDLNLAVRGYAPTNADLKLVDFAGDTDPAAPQLNTLFGDRRVPAFTGAYQEYQWDWDCNCRGELNTNWDVTVLGMGVAPGEIIHVPDSGYDIGGGYEVLVLYASETRITLKYTREDDVVYGYTLHVEDVCVEPDLLALYRQMNAAGRERLPAMRAGRAFGRALSGEIKVAIRDSGTFLDPRSRKDWWQNVSH